MANYALTVTPKFTPFTYDELVKPVEAYQKVYDAYNEKYDAIEDEISKYKSLEKSDLEAYARYADYVSKLQVEKDSIATKGLSSATRKNFSDLRRQYAEQIAPMTEAEKRKKELVKNYEDMKKTDPTLLTDIDPREIKLSQLIENPDMGFESYSGKLLQAQMENQMSALASEIMSNPIKWNNATMLQHYGFTRQQVLDALKNPYDTNSQNIINQFGNRVLESSGILDWNTSDEIKQNAYNWVMQGAMKGVGKDSLEADFYARQAAQNKDSQKEKLLTVDTGNNVYYSYTYGTYVRKDDKGNLVSLPVDEAKAYESKYGLQAQKATSSKTAKPYKSDDYTVSYSTKYAKIVQPSDKIPDNVKASFADTQAVPSSVLNASSPAELWGTLKSKGYIAVDENTGSFVISEEGVEEGLTTDKIKALHNILYEEVDAKKQTK